MVTMSTGRSLRLALEESEVPPFDDDFASDIASALAMVSDAKVTLELFPD